MLLERSRLELLRLELPRLEPLRLALESPRHRALCQTGVTTQMPRRRFRLSELASSRVKLPSRVCMFDQSKMGYPVRGPVPALALKSVLARPCAIERARNTLVVTNQQHRGMLDLVGVVFGAIGDASGCP